MGDMDLDIKTNNIVRTMQELGVQRFITISAGGIYKELLQAFNE
jgi:purine nucleoside phosphorylase